MRTGRNREAVREGYDLTWEVLSFLLFLSQLNPVLRASLITVIYG